jgi:putative IMPACT (imprinted ancient) family translation regulator
MRTHDGGEPAGTAGRPILAAIDRAGLADVLVIVTRWFGGVKLGKGGLARAYGEAATLALSRAVRETRYFTEGLLVVFPHACTGEVMHAVSRAGARLRDTTYDEEVHLLLDVPRSRVAPLVEELTERTAGNLRVVRKGPSAP